MGGMEHFVVSFLLKNGILAKPKQKVLQSLGPKKAILKS